MTDPLANIAPEDGCLEDEFPFGMAQFQRQTVSFREGITNPQVHKTAILLMCSFKIYLIYPNKVKLTIKNHGHHFCDDSNSLLKNTIFGFV